MGIRSPDQIISTKGFISTISFDELPHTIYKSLRLSGHDMNDLKHWLTHDNIKLIHYHDEQSDLYAVIELLDENIVNVLQVVGTRLTVAVMSAMEEYGSVFICGPASAAHRRLYARLGWTDYINGQMIYTRSEHARKTI